MGGGRSRDGIRTWARLVRVAAWTAGAGVAGGLAIAPLWPDQHLLFLANLAVALAFAAGGALLWEEPGHRPSAVALGLTAVLWPASWLNEWQAGPLPLISVLEEPLPIVLAAWALLRYPRRWFGRRTERLLLGALAVVQLGVLPQVVTSRPGWQDLPPGATWPALWPDHAAYRACLVGYEVLTWAVAVAFGVAFLAQLSRLRGPDQRAALPVAVAAAAACVALTVTGVAWLATASHRVEYLFSDVEALIVACVPVSLLLTVLRRRLAGEKTGRLATRLAEGADAETVRDAAREALGDPSVEIWYWLPEPASWVDCAGRPAGGDPAVAGGRMVAEIRTAAGAPLAVLTGDESLRGHGGLVADVVRAITLSLENARLQAEIRAETRRVALSTERVEGAVGAEQRRVERAIRDGIQRRLAGVDLTLSGLIWQLPDGAARAEVSRARAQLRETRSELNLLASGQAPPVLTREGLGPAVRAMAARQLVPVRVDVPAERLGGQVERAAYFLIAETVSNAVKHAHPRAVTIRVARTGPAGGVDVEVRDDGRGGADPHGNGLRGVARRVRALGGQFTIHSRPGEGTTVRARLPRPDNPVESGTAAAVPEPRSHVTNNEIITPDERPGISP